MIAAIHDTDSAEIVVVWESVDEHVAALVHREVNRVFLSATEDARCFLVFTTFFFFVTLCVSLHGRSAATASHVVVEATPVLKDEKSATVHIV